MPDRAAARRHVRAARRAFDRGNLILAREHLVEAREHLLREHPALFFIQGALRCSPRSERTTWKQLVEKAERALTPHTRRKR